MASTWRWWPPAGEVVRVIGSEELWGTSVADVVRPDGRVERVPDAELRPLSGRAWGAPELRWRAAAARAIQLAADGEPLATRTHNVELLPHQLATLERALELDPVRLAICDEVGLGKTITASAIFSELKARGKVARTLIVAPKGVQLQWVAELAERFGEEFVRVGPEGLPVDGGVNPWRAFDQVVCSIDAVKPIRARAGWDAARVAEHNRLRFEAVAAAGWDLVVIDEAHHVAGSSEEVARHRLAIELAQKTEHMLLLSATPHSGKSDGFRRLLGLLDDGFIHGRPLNRDTVGPYIARTEKATAVDHQGRPLFTERTTSLEIVPYQDRAIERALYEAVTEYVREGYGRAVREKRPAVGFLVLLFQRLVSSSTAAIRTALERRSAVLDEGTDDQLRLFGLDEWEELTGEEQFEALTAARGVGWASERHEVARLLDLARRAESSGPDAKALFFLRLMRRLQRDEGDPNLKVLVFTEFVPTQDMILKLLDSAGIHAVAINGSMGLAERAMAQDAFRNDAQVLVSTDAGGEGINLQFAHIACNWDLPWTPGRLEQRFGRVSRIGQTHPVRGFNMATENSIDARVLEVLEAKLATILAELGADKRGDVLESASSRSEAVYVSAIAGTGVLDAEADTFAAETKADVVAQDDVRDLLHQQLRRPRSSGMRLRDALDTAAAALGELRGAPVADPLDAVASIPSVAPGEPVPELDGVADGWWGLWELRADARSDDRTAMALFIPGQGFPRPDLAAEVWEQAVRIDEVRTGDAPDPATWEKLTTTAHDHAYGLCSALAGETSPPNPIVRPIALVRVRP